MPLPVINWVRPVIARNNTEKLGSLEVEPDGSIYLHVDDEYYNGYVATSDARELYRRLKKVFEPTEG